MMTYSRYFRRIVSSPNRSAGAAVGCAVAALLWLVPATASGQSKAPAVYDPAFVEQILKRLDAQEKELKELRATREGKDVVEHLPKAETFPKLSFHGFGDVSYVWDDQAGPSRNRFLMGQLDFFVTSRLSENLSVMGEFVVEADQMNNFVFEIERLLLQWRSSDYFHLAIGRYHTAIGYYNTAYHHGSWFQTAVGRPGFLDFEDGGGLIPAHTVGLSANGRIPSGKLDLGYFAEVGNGRHYHDPASGQNPIQNFSDDNDYKAFNFGLTAQPEWIPGLQVGAGVYFDRLTPDTLPKTDELILHAHAVYKAGPWEFLSEAHYLRHSPQIGSASTTPAFFAQIAHRFGVLTPYARFSYINASDNDAVWQLIGSNGLRYGPGVGLRWDFSALAAFKIQYDFEIRRGFSDLSKLTLQASFTF